VINIKPADTRVEKTSVPPRFRLPLAVLPIAVLLTLLTGSPGAAADGLTEVTTTRVAIGKSVKGRTIWAIHRTRPGATKRVVVIGQVHGDETAGIGVTSRLHKAALPANLDLWIIPTANPDGRAAGTRTNARGVDRNFPYRWRRINVGRPTYSGPGAASEPETKALHAFITKIEPRITITFHQPLYGVGKNDKRPEIHTALSRATGLPVKDYACSGVCYGSFTSWHNRYRRGVAVTVEFGRTASAWRLDKAAAATLSVGARR
jgi:protein MpaA